ncbi:MAG: ABC transporter ATP-binding protein [Alphaproteobacteria bacterium CG_4_10_14_0_8_um_filter_53_9]|nr:MAG: ABC transporter ATP-binding protein [Alphaproteobacteria bacterium CG_4_10_14_0_8_um_filter_53_9]
MPESITLKNVSKSFGSNQVLVNASLDIPAGKTTVILGGSGSGKSVLLKCILGLIHADSGLIKFGAESVLDMDEPARMAMMRKLGMLFQSGALFDSMSVWENVAFALLEDGMKPTEAKEIAITKLRQVGLRSAVADLSPAELSGGMKKRAALARAVCHEPSVIFYDEPTTGLDPITSDVINDLIIQLQDEYKATSVVITHDMHTAFKIADKMAFLYKGSFLSDGDPKDFKDSKNPYVAQFVAGSAQGPIEAAV